MDKHIRDLRKKDLLEWFDDDNAERVVSWLVAAEGRRPVVLVGAGFTLNARQRGTGKAPTREQVPLWQQLVEKAANDINVSPAGYDAPTVFDLYAEVLGTAKLRDKLRSSLADDELEAGEAHRALAAYGAEAIVTTNCLDTVLDQVCSNGWRRVIADADLSCAGELRDLIYVHGHRAFSDSWVMTRSQYEDFGRTKPVIVTRVRQLLAQHPWLIVGFSMNDPNFHSITRLLGTDMRGHQPLSLALMTKPLHAAERLHWRRLGFEVVAPSADAVGRHGLGSFFSSVFGKLETKYSPTEDAAKAYVNDAGISAERLLRFRLVNPPPILQPNEVLEEWKGQLRSMLLPEELASATGAVNEAHALRFPAHLRRSVGLADKASSSVRLSSSGLHSLLRELDEDEGAKFSLATIPVVQWLSQILQKADTGAQPLFEHFAWALERRLFERSPEDASLVLVALRLADKCCRDDARKQAMFRQALDLATTYKQVDLAAAVEREAQRQSLDLAGKRSEGTEQRSHIRKAREGFLAFLDARFRDAAIAYEEAARDANAESLEFELWVYRWAQAAALERLAEDSPFRALRPNDPQIDRKQFEVRAREVRKEVDRLSRLPLVERWVREANERKMRALEEVSLAFLDRERSRAVGSDTRRFSRAAHSLWRSFRELCVVEAPPGLRHVYMQPLLPFCDAKDAADVFQNTRHPERWIDDVLGHSVRSLEERRKRDERLIETVLADASNQTRSELVGRLASLPKLSEVYRRDDIPRVRKWLEEAVQRLRGGHLDIALGSGTIDGDYWSTFEVVARWGLEPVEALECARCIAEHLGNAHQDGALKGLYNLPLHLWEQVDPGIATSFFALLTHLLPEAPKGVHQLAFTHAFFAAYRMLEAGLSADAWKASAGPWTAVLDSAQKLSKDEASYAEVKRAGFFLERKLVRMNLVERIEADLFGRWFDCFERVPVRERGEMWGTLVDALEPGELLTDQQLKLIQTECRSLIDDPGAFRHYELNPHLAYSATRLLCAGLRFLPDKDGREKIAQSLCTLLESAPETVASTHEVLRKDLWPPHEWARLTSLLAGAAMGRPLTTGTANEDAGCATRAQLAVFDLFGNLSTEQLQALEPSTRYALEGACLAGVVDDRALVANQAAFAIVKAAKGVSIEADAQRYAVALARVAEDPRVSVRNAIADAGPSLARGAASEAIRAAAAQGVKVVTADDNAQVAWLLARAHRKLS